MIRPKPQLSQDAIAAATKLRATARLGVVAKSTNRRRPACTAGALASECPVTRTRIIWKANPAMLKMPPYHDERISAGEPFGAKIAARRPVRTDSAMARMKGSGITRSNRYTKKATSLCSGDRAAVHGLDGWRLLHSFLLHEAGFTRSGQVVPAAALKQRHQRTVTPDDPLRPVVERQTRAP